MVKSEREKVLSELTSRIFESMVDEIVMDAALSSHHEIARARAVCHVCHTRCGLDHSPNVLSSMNQPVASSSRHPTPSVESKALNGSSGTGTSTPTSVKAEGAIYECLNCKRQIASNRYATHLSGCMGIGTGTRRATNRSNVKAKVSSEAGRSESPYVGSENGTMSDDASPSPAKGKGKSKSKRVDEAEFNLKRKRPGSPQISPIISKSKKQKTSGSPVSRVRADSDASNSYQLPSTGSQSKVPSKLRESSIASFDPSRSSPSSRSTSPGTPIASMSTPASAISTQSPPRPGKKKGRPPKPKSNGNSKVLPPKQPSPPRPPPPAIRVPDPDYLVDVEGEETGSSTDTDSS